MREIIVSYCISQIFVALMDLMLSSLTSSECFLLMDNTDPESYHQVVSMVLGTVLVKKKTAFLLKRAKPEPQSTVAVAITTSYRSLSAASLPFLGRRFSCTVVSCGLASGLVPDHLTYS